MPNKKTGQEFSCMICGKIFYRRRSYIARGIRKTCGKPECKSASMRGENNPFWGKVHDEATRLKIRSGRQANPPKKRTGPPKGYRHTPAAREKITAALRRRWIENRDTMIAALPRGEDHPFYKGPDFRRYRKNFTRQQRKEWRADKCQWCEGTDRLNLDHIIPVFDGGQPEKRNSQTLCHPCNLWKSIYVDRPRFLAGVDLGSKGGQI